MLSIYLLTAPPEISNPRRIVAFSTLFEFKIHIKHQRFLQSDSKWKLQMDVLRPYRSMMLRDETPLGEKFSYGQLQAQHTRIDILYKVNGCKVHIRIQVMNGSNIMTHYNIESRTII